MAGIKDISVIIFDVGPNSKERINEKEQTFFQREQDCVQKILLRKLLTRPTDECMLLLMGTETTDNELNSEMSNYEHITAPFPMAAVTWNMVKYLEQSMDEVEDGVTADWLDAIIIAMHYLRPYESTKTKLKIFLLATFNTDIDVSQADVVIDGLKSMKIELVVITSSILYEIDDCVFSQKAVFSHQVAKDSVRKNCEQLIQKIVEDTDGALCSFDEAIQQLVYYEQKQKRRMPWNCDLEISKLLQIKIAAYIYIREESKPIKFTSRGQSGQKTKTMTEHFHNDQPVETDVVLDQVIKGYMYATETVPYKSESIGYNSGEKSLKCIGFTNQTAIRDEYFMGTGVWTVVAQKNCPVAEKMLAALANVMHDMSLAMIARYVYRGGTSPKMMAIFPANLQGKRNSLAMYELIFKENHIRNQLPPLKIKKTELNENELEAVDKLIDSMDLMSVKLEAGDDENPSTAVHGEAFRNLMDPVLQHTYRTIAKHALHPKEPLRRVDPEVIALVNVPPSVKEQTLPHAEKVKELFQLEPVVHNTASRKNLFYNQIQSIQSDPSSTVDAQGVVDMDNTSNLVEIGTITPDEDFDELLKRGENYKTIATQMQNVIVRIITQSMSIPEDKIKRAIMTYRENAKLMGPIRYNDWMFEFRDWLKSQRKENVWQTFIVNERFGLITAEESLLSEVTEDDAMKFYNTEVPTTEVNPEPVPEEDDLSLFDEM